MRNWIVLWVVSGVLALAGGCRCGTTTTVRTPEINVDLAALDFGTVQVGLTHELSLRLYNSGTAPLNVFEFRVAPPFAVVEAPPVLIAPGTEALLTVSYTPPTPDKRDQGTLVLVSDDPAQGEVSVRLNGIGITAQASATPSPVPFGDVWVGEAKTVPVTVHNRGTAELAIVKAEFLPGTPAAITGDLGPLSQPIPGGGDAQAQLTYRPTEMTLDIPGGIRLELDPNQGGELLIPFSGRGVRAIPRLCFRFEGSGVEQCTQPNAAGGVGTNIDVAFPPLCDSRVTPPDAGTTAQICQGAPYEQSGQFYVKNEGNVPVRYTMKYLAATSRSCDGGTPDRSDFAFSNQPDGGVLEWTEGTAQLPGSEADPRPWETAPRALSYRPTSWCPEEAADSARIEWTRQGDSRQPLNLFAFVTGQSRLPRAVEHPLTVTGRVPTTVSFAGAQNRGNAAFQITDVKLYGVVGGPGSGCAGPDAGFFQDCALADPGDPFNDCHQFAWADGGHPLTGAPHTVPAADGGSSVVQYIGRLVFGPNAGNPPAMSQKYCVYSVVQTTDPYHGTITSRIQGERTE